MAGLWLYFSCFEEAHRLVEYCETAGGRTVARDPASPGAGLRQCRLLVPKSRPAPHIFTKLSHAAIKILRRIRGAEFRTGRWDPFAFIAFCDRARKQPDSMQMQAAMEIQRAEWQILFDYCARLSESE